MKKIVVFGGGTGLSQILKGLIQFPLDITAVVSVSDNGKSTGKLRDEFAIPAVGDVTKVLMSMSLESNDVKNLFNYRFSEDSSLSMHSIKNLIMTALLEMKGDFAHSIPILCDLLDVKGHILPITEDNVDLVGITKEGYEIIGEEQITSSKREIVDLKYSKKVHANVKVIDAIKKADLIIVSSGSLITSIMPHVIIDEVKDALCEAKAPIMYISNIITQPGETDGFKVSDHIISINNHLSSKKISVVVANDCKFPRSINSIVKSEKKELVKLDKKELEKMNVKIISDKLYKIDDGNVRHDSLKTAYLVFSYLMDGE